MFNKKNARIASLLALTLASVSANAYILPPVQDPGLLVFLPNPINEWDFYGAAVWLQAGASNLNYVIYNKELPAQSPSWTEREISPDYSPGFELGVRWTFPCSGGKDMLLSWTHLTSSASASTVAPNDNFFLGPDYEIGPAGLPIRNSTGKANFDYDVVNWDVGQRVNFGNMMQVRFSAGLSAASLREEVIATFSGTTDGIFAGPFRTQQDVNSRFRGIGPRFAFSGEYVSCWGLGFLAEGGASALIGTSYAKTNFTSSAQELLTLYGQSINHQFIKDQHVVQVIPGFDTKLGVNFKYLFNNGMLFGIAAGYQAAVYINAISQYLPGSLVGSPPAPLESGGIFVSTMEHRLSNYSVQGPFLRASLTI